MNASVLPKSNLQKRRRPQPKGIWIFLGLFIVGLIFLAPLVWMVVVSFERYANITPHPPTFLVKEPFIFNYVLALQNGYLLNACKNSFLIAVLNVLWTLFSSIVPGHQGEARRVWL